MANYYYKVKAYTEQEMLRRNEEAIEDARTASAYLGEVVLAKAPDSVYVERIDAKTGATEKKDLSNVTAQTLIKLALGQVVRISDKNKTPLCRVDKEAVEEFYRNLNKISESEMVDLLNTAKAEEIRLSYVKDALTPINKFSEANIVATHEALFREGREATLDDIIRVAKERVIVKQRLNAKEIK